MFNYLAYLPPSLTPGQFSLVYNSFSLCIAAMIAAAIFFFNAKSEVGEKYRPAILVSGVVVTVAAYHYFRIFNSWDEAYIFESVKYYSILFRLIYIKIYILYIII